MNICDLVDHVRGSKAHHLLGVKGARSDSEGDPLTMTPTFLYTITMMREGLMN